MDGLAQVFQFFSLCVFIKFENLRICKVCMDVSASILNHRVIFPARRQRPEKGIWCLLSLPTYEAQSLPEPGVCGFFLLFFSAKLEASKPPLVLSLLLPEMVTGMCRPSSLCGAESKLRAS